MDVDSSDKIDFFLKDSGQSKFNFVRENFVFLNDISLSLCGKLSENSAGLWENKFKEFRIGNSVFPMSVVFLEDGNQIFFEDYNRIFSKSW